MTHYLRLSSVFLLLFFFACASPYKGLQQQSVSTPSALRFKPVFDKVLYRCVVDGRVVFKRFHLSGLLFFKTMDDGSTRAVFQNEMGFTFFDFEWSPTDSFQVNKIIPQLDKAAVIKILEKDMDLLLMKNLNRQTETVFTSGSRLYHRFDLEKGVAYYIVNNGKLERIENAGKSKVITITLGEKETDTSMPGTVFFNHHKANFTIDLKKIEAHADE